VQQFKGGSQDPEPPDVTAPPARLGGIYRDGHYGRGGGLRDVRTSQMQAGNLEGLAEFLKDASMANT
jgi:hypothetical protein